MEARSESLSTYLLEIKVGKKGKRESKVAEGMASLRGAKGTVQSTVGLYGASLEIVYLF